MYEEIATAPDWSGPWEIIFSTDMLMFQFPTGEDRQEDRRRIATGDYLIKIGLRPDEAK
jgi:hypothetical protein